MKILFIQHASAFGGSVMSLLYTIEGIRFQNPNHYQIVIALAKGNIDLERFYSKAGFKVVKSPLIDTYEHTQAFYFNVINPIGIIKEIIQRLRIIRAKKNTIKLLNEVKPDIVHLNSVVLLGSAIAAKECKIPLVWHVRETAVKGLFGIRKKMIQKKLNTLPCASIFICKSDMESWSNPETGFVVYNFVNIKDFRPQTKKNLSIEGKIVSKNNFNILFLGGVNKIKGTIVILKALSLIKKSFPTDPIMLIFAGGIYDTPNYLVYKVAYKILPLFGFGTYSQICENIIQKTNLETNIIRLPFVKEISKVFQSSDILVFPSIRPHFARPIIEASAMAIASIGSNISSIKELIDPGVDGLLFETGNEKELSQKIIELYKNKILSKKLGTNAFNRAKLNYNQIENIQKIIKIYQKIIEK